MPDLLVDETKVSKSPRRQGGKIPPINIARLKSVKSGVPLSRQAVYRDLTLRDPIFYKEFNGFPGP